MREAFAYWSMVAGAGILTVATLAYWAFGICFCWRKIHNQEPIEVDIGEVMMTAIGVFLVFASWNAIYFLLPSGGKP